MVILTLYSYYIISLTFLIALTFYNKNFLRDIFMVLSKFYFYFLNVRKKKLFLICIPDFSDLTSFIIFHKRGNKQRMLLKY